MIYIGLPQWSHPKWVRLGITSLEEYARHFNCGARGNDHPVCATEAGDCRPLVTNRLTMTSASASNFRPPSRTRPPLRHCDELSSEFLPARPGAAGFAHRPVLAAAAGDVRSSRSPRAMAFLDGLPKDFTYGRRSSSSRVFRQRGSGTAAQPRAALSVTSTA